MHGKMKPEALERTGGRISKTACGSGRCSAIITLMLVLFGLCDLETALGPRCNGSGRQTGIGAGTRRERPVDGALADAPGCARARRRYARAPPCRRAACARAAGGAGRHWRLPRARASRARTWSRSARASPVSEPPDRRRGQARRSGGGRYRTVRAGPAAAWAMSRSLRSPVRTARAR